MTYERYELDGGFFSVTRSPRLYAAKRAGSWWVFDSTYPRDESGRVKDPHCGPFSSQRNAEKWIKELRK